MSDHRLNEYGQPIGLPVSLELPRPAPPHTTLRGRLVELVAMHSSHAPGFYECFTDPAGWTYLGEDVPFESIQHAQEWTDARVPSHDPLFYTVLQAGKPVGFCSFLRIAPGNGVIEIGYIHFSPVIQGTPAATEAQYLMMRHVFDDLGYRRYEWKCDALNAPSRTAAQRLGFTFEGIFRQAVVYKGRNRDTAWFSILDSEWPAIKARFETWLSPDNFDHNGQQKSRLQNCAGKPG
ncbi:GNAT family N-acetyltransferase [Thalassococcus lentus]|uniref:GNAT family protein n=1 Tax=Thalassococcus lentus TaxID=1210524 RepID=A0ABT4XX09_9RHOB|nr:GNAT family protein [Thalassococcus lentus]MDA7426489.1 GNAT family protein [Thalassococcus lentus]